MRLTFVVNCISTTNIKLTISHSGIVGYSILHIMAFLITIFGLFVLELTP